MSDDIDATDFLPPELQEALDSQKLEAAFVQAQPLATVEGDFKNWIITYPIYYDVTSTSRYRKVPKSLAIEGVMAVHVAKAAGMLSVRGLLEKGKRHPADWGRDGRVRIELKHEGRFLNPRITSRKQLHQEIAKLLPAIKREYEEVVAETETRRKADQEGHKNPTGTKKGQARKKKRR